MPDAPTTTSSLDFDQTMWDLAIYHDLRPELYFDGFADVKSTNAAPDQGAVVSFSFMEDMADATSTLSETADVDAVALTDSQVTVTLAEKGNAVLTTYKLHATSFVPLDPAIASIIGYNGGRSIDSIARDVMVAGTNVRYAGAATSRVTVAAAHVLKSTNVRRASVDLKQASAATFGGYYAAVINPDVGIDLREESGGANWRDPHTYSEPANIWNGEFGSYEGFRFVESPRAKVFVDAGVTSTVDVYASLFFGRQALAKGYSTYGGRGALPKVIMGPVTDKLMRFRPIGWHWFGGYSVFRQPVLRRVESSSSIAVNV